jgi:hypothetical protein
MSLDREDAILCRSPFGRRLDRNLIPSHLVPPDNLGIRFLHGENTVWLAGLLQSGNHIPTNLAPALLGEVKPAVRGK